MKIIHTADWHRKILNGKPELLEGSSVYFRYVRRKMKEEEPDIIVIAGIYMTQHIK